MLKSILPWLKYQHSYTLTMPYVTTQMQKDNISISVKRVERIASSNLFEVSHVTHRA